MRNLRILGLLALGLLAAAPAARPVYADTPQHANKVVNEKADQMNAKVKREKAKMHKKSKKSQPKRAATEQKK